MTRTPRDWRESAQNRISEKHEEIIETVADHHDTISVQGNDLLDLAYIEDPQRDELRRVTTDLRDALLALAEDAYDLAYDVHKFKSGPTLRNLQGEEPVGYSKPDFGATHDAMYGGQAQEAHFARHISWPLNLGEWEKETATLPPQTHQGHDHMPDAPDEEPVVAEGTTKYTRTIGGRQVHLVVDNRTRDPPI